MKRHLKVSSKSVFNKQQTNQKVLKRLWDKAASLPKSSIITIFAFAIVGTLLLFVSFASTSTSSIQPEDSAQKTAGISDVSDPNASGGAAIKFGSPPPVNTGVRRFFSDNASWNKTVSQLGISGSFSGYTTRLFNYGGAGGWDDPVLGATFNPSTRGSYNLALRDYSVPIYKMSDKTTMKRLYWSSWAFPYANYYVCDGPGVAPCTGNQTRIVMPAGTQFPWNPAWAAGTGTDQMMTVVDYDTGEAWTYYGTNAASYQCTIFGGGSNWSLNYAATPAYDPNNTDHMCMSGVTRIPNVYAVDGTNTTEGRGMGIDKLALLTRAEEVESGEIRHALELTIFNQMFGPVCNPDSPTTAGAGVSCAFHLAPATRVEHLSTPNGGGCGANQLQMTDANRSKTIPSGMRFRVNRDDASIESWLDSRSYSGVKRSTAKIFAKALVDYGFIAAAETGCNQPLIETDGMQNPATKQKWLNLGITDTGIDYDGNPDGSADGKPDYPGGDLLYGFITSTNLQVVNPQ